MFKIFLYWLPMIPIAFINAAIREMVFVKRFSVMQSHQLSTISLIILCSVYVWLVLPFLKTGSAANAFTTGLVWVALTMLFEIILGLLTGKSLSEMLLQYNVLKGYWWPVFLFALLLMPPVFYVLQKRTL